MILEGKCNLSFKWKDRQKVHGLGVLVEILDYITVEGHSLVCRNQSEDVGGFLWFYEKILDFPETLVQFSLTEPRTVRNYLNKLQVVAEKKPIKLEKYVNEDPKWFKSMVQILFLSHEAIYNVRKSNILMKKLDKRMAFTYDFYYSEKVRAFKESTIRTLSNAVKNTKIKQIGLISSDEMELDKYLYSRDIWQALQSEAYVSNLAEIERIVKIQMDEDIIELPEEICSESELIRIGMSSGTFALFGYAENLLQKIMDLYAEFKYYEVFDVAGFRELINNTEWENDWNLSIKKLKVGPFEKEISVIEMEVMDELLQYLESEILRRTEEVRYGSIFEDSRMTTKLNELHKVHKGLREVIDLAIVDEHDIERAIRIVKYNQCYMRVQEYYIISYLDEQKNPKNRRIDVSEIPYQELYKKMSRKLKNETPDYYQQLMQKYIKEGITEYIERISR